MGFFDKLKKINIFASFGSELTDDFYDELEESLILADTGMDVTLELVEALRRRVREERIKTMEEARSAMVQIIAEAMNTGGAALDLSTTPSVVLFIGVNGVGKTTTIGKIGHQLRKEGKKVLFCAADTFRAAAAEQLTIRSLGAVFHSQKYFGIFDDHAGKREKKHPKRCTRAAQRKRSCDTHNAANAHASR